MKSPKQMDMMSREVGARLEALGLIERLLDDVRVTPVSMHTYLAILERYEYARERASRIGDRSLERALCECERLLHRGFVEHVLTSVQGARAAS
ncbi:MAG: hypothetical protein AAGI01_16410 [Myxococcota bacterium]